MKFKNLKKLTALSLALTILLGNSSHAMQKEFNGRDRVETSMLTSKEVKSDIVVVTDAYNFADSLSASNLVNRFGAKLILVDKNTDLKSISAKSAFVIGGRVSNSVIEQLKLITNNNVNVIKGSDRYVTNKKSLDITGIRAVGIADGRNYPDALSANPLLKQEGLGLLLLDGSKSYHPETGKYITKYTFGGKNSMKVSYGERISGSDRYSTNTEIIRKLKNTNKLAIASGENFADAMAAINLNTEHNAITVITPKGATVDFKNKDIFWVGNVKAYVKDKTSETKPVDTSSSKDDSKTDIKVTQPKQDDDKPVEIKKPEIVVEVPKDDDAPNVDVHMDNGYGYIIGQKQITDRYFSDNASFKSWIKENNLRYLPELSKDQHKYFIPKSYKVITSKEDFEKEATISVATGNYKYIALILPNNPQSKEFMQYDPTLATEMNKVLNPSGLRVAMDTPYTWNIQNHIVALGQMRMHLDNEYWTYEQYNPQEWQAHVERCKNALKKLGIYKSNKRDYEKMRIATDFLMKYAQYSRKVENGPRGTNIEQVRRNRSPYTIFLNREGVCRAFVYNLSLMANLMDIPNYQLANSEHVQLRAKLNGTWITIDPTPDLDNTLTSEFAFNAKSIVPPNDADFEKTMNYVHNLGFRRTNFFR